MRRWITRLGFGWLVWRVFGPEPAPRFAPDQVHPLRVPGRSVFVGDRELFVREAGPPAAPPLILVHGWGDHTQIIWYRLIPRLAERYRVVAIDMRSHGRSATRRGRFQVSDLADDVAGVMNELEIGSAAVFGYSLGGMTSQVLAHRYPGRVRALILGGTHAGGIGTARRVVLGGVWIAGRALDRISRVELAGIRYGYLITMGVVSRRHERWLWDEMMARDPELYWQTGFAALRFDSTDWVQRLDQPTMVIIPTKDQLVPPAGQYDLAGRLPDPELVELEGARHEAPLTHAAQIAAAVDAFLEKVSNP